MFSMSSNPEISGSRRSRIRQSNFFCVNACSASAPVPAVEISATDVRARVRAGASIRWRVPEAVARYIAAERLYFAQER